MGENDFEDREPWRPPWERVHLDTLKNRGPGVYTSFLRLLESFAPPRQPKKK